VSFTFENLIQMFEDKRKIHGIATYRHISEILREAKSIHKKYFDTRPDMTDHEQSWRAFKGNNLEKLLLYILTTEVKELGLKIFSGNSLKQNSSKRLDEIFDKVKRNLLVDYGEFGMHLPDVDLVIFDPSDGYVLAVISIKVTLRERISQTGYWKLKLSSAPVTKDIKVYFITLDEDGTLTFKNPTKKSPAIVETDTDGSYVMTEVNIEEGGRVKKFDQFISDIKILSESRKRHTNLSF
jgi:type II restriction enzyme